MLSSLWNALKSFFSALDRLSQLQFVGCSLTFVLVSHVGTMFTILAVSLLDNVLNTPLFTSTLAVIGLLVSYLVAGKVTLKLYHYFCRHNGQPAPH